MRVDERDGLRVHRFDTLPDAFVTTRSCGNLAYHVTPDPESVDRHRDALFAAFDLPAARAAWCEQVHGGAVAVIDTPGTCAPGADALVTNRVDVPLCVMMADCVPIVLVDPERHVLGVVHAGWPGTTLRLASATVRAMTEHFGTDPTTILAAIGPSIGPDDYEVGPDVIERVRNAYGDAPVLRDLGGEKALLDLWAANTHDLRSVGVTQIEVAGVSTARSLDDFYSHRFEPGGTGRFALIATLRDLG